ncbi:ATP-binding protein [Streptomyces griseus]|uniref:ATP-binding protein n=1 Tax=Streptomyces griseus TaxID=1911 RepID=UPI0033C1761C
MSQAPHPRNTPELADTPNAVPRARLHTAEILSRWGVPSEAAETVQLLVSELVTNAVQHPQEEGEERQVSILSSRNTSQTFELTLEKLWDAVRVSVWDRDARPPCLKEVGVEAESGRGIFIVAVMSRAWGYRPAVGIPGKVVWAEVGLLPIGRVGEDERAVRPPGSASVGRARNPEGRAGGPELARPRARRCEGTLSRGRDRPSRIGARRDEGAVLLGAPPVRRSADGEPGRAGSDSRNTSPPAGRSRPRPGFRRDEGDS